MVKKQLPRIVLTIVGISFAYLLFNLPKHLVSNGETIETGGGHNNGTQNTSVNTEDNFDHTPSIKPELQAHINHLKEKIVENFSQDDNFIIFADSLASAYMEAMVYDSSIAYLSKIYDRNNSIENLENLANGAFLAYSYNGEPALKTKYGNKAKGLYEELNKIDSTKIDNRVKLAVLVVGTERPPMRGIGMLKTVIEQHPENTEARLYLGEFMLTVNKYEKAINQFTEVLKYDPSSLKAHIYLVDCYLFNGDKEKARKHIEIIQTLSSGDEYLKMFVERKLEEINQ